MTVCFQHISWEGSFLGTPTDINERTIGSGDGASLSIVTLLGNMEGVSLTRNFEFFFLVYISGFLFLDPEEVANLSCGTEEETAVHVLCGCEALASLRHAYLGSFFLDPEDVKNLSMGGHLELWQRDRAPLN